MGTVSYTTGNDMSGGKYLDTPGEFHMIIEGVAWPPVDKDGCELVKRLFDLKVKVLAGPSGSEGKEWTIKFWKPGDSEFKQKLVDRALMACGFVMPGQTNTDVNIDTDEFAGRQLLCKITRQEDNEKYLNLDYLNIFHVDDPEAASYPRDAEAIAGIEASLRWTKAQQDEQPTEKPNESQPAKRF